GEHPGPWRHGLHLGVRLPPVLPAREAAVAQPRQRARVEGSSHHPSRNEQRPDVRAEDTMDFDDTPQEAEFRAGARAFLEKNAKRREPGSGMVYRAGNEDPAFRKRAKDWQAKKADAGYAGITW